MLSSTWHKSKPRLKWAYTRAMKLTVHKSPMVVYQDKKQQRLTIDNPIPGLANLANDILVVQAQNLQLVGLKKM